MPRKPKISPQDAELFRQTVGPVKPVVNDRVIPEAPRPRPVPLQRQLDDEQILSDMLSEAFDPAELETGEELLFIRGGMQPKSLRRLRRGQFSVEAELDMHGMTVAVARQELADFLTECRRRRARCIRVIHGKGNGSRHRRPVLKHKLNHWLRQRDEVLAFCSARGVDGGTGAVYVLLKHG